MFDLVNDDVIGQYYKGLNAIGRSGGLRTAYPACRSRTEDRDVAHGARLGRNGGEPAIPIRRPLL
jgi:hypothetical protein